jgi:hypothetical protein
MRNRYRWILPMVVLATAGAGLPSRADAQQCTAKYQKCLNDTWETSGFARMLADAECFAVYSGCVAKQLMQ